MIFTSFSSFRNIEIQGVSGFQKDEAIRNLLVSNPVVSAQVIWRALLTIS